MKKPTKAQLKETKRLKELEVISAKGYKAFAIWDKANNIGQPWENSLGPKSKTIRENLFMAGWFAMEASNFWKRQAKRRPRVSHTS